MENEFSLKKVAVFIVLIVVLIAIPLTVYLAQRQQETRSRATGISPTPSPTSAVPTQCNDNLDNDSDGFTDVMDPGCDNFLENSETNTAGACTLQTIWQLGTFGGPSQPLHPNEYPADDQHTPTFEYTVIGSGSATPVMPGYISDRKLSEIDPARALTDATTNLKINFTLPNNVTNAKVIWSRYGSETNVLKLDGTVIRTTSGGTEGTNYFFKDPITLSAGSHTLEIQYQGGGIDNGNYLDAIGIVGCVAGQCTVPGKATNVKVTCPNCFSSESVLSPTPTP